MLITQGNPGWDLSDGTRAPLRDPKTLVQTDGQPDGYHDFLSALRDEVIAFRKPVAYVHGDSHYFRVDKPFQDASGRRIENFTRVETFGDNAPNGNNDVHSLRTAAIPVRSRPLHECDEPVTASPCFRLERRTRSRLCRISAELRPEIFALLESHSRETASQDVGARNRNG